jgi:hypothetical protein
MGKLKGLTPADVKLYREFSQDWADLWDGYVYRDFCKQLSALTRKDSSKRKPGRPKSKVKSADFIRKQFLDKFDFYLWLAVRALKDKHYDLPWLSRREIWLREDFYPAFIKHTRGKGKEVVGDTPKEVEIFHVGAVFTAWIIRTIVLEFTLRNSPRGSTLTEQVKQTKKGTEWISSLLKKRGLSDEAIEILKKNKLAELPTDLRRKVLTPPFSRAAIALFTRTIKEIEGLPYVEEVTRRLGESREHVMRLKEEARRLGVAISIEKGQKGDYFMIK